MNLFLFQTGSYEPLQQVHMNLLKRDYLTL